MTAEIAILNKTAVVLAADSAMTIGRGGNAKIYNTVNKIFEISDVQPIGLMVFNRLDFMDLPIEVLAKEYRKTCGKKAFDRVSDYRDDFMRFLRHEVSSSEEDINSNCIVITNEALELISGYFSIKLRDSVRANGKLLKSKFNGMLQEVAKRQIDKLQKIGHLKGYAKHNFPDDLKATALSILKDKLRFVEINSATEKVVFRYLNHYFRSAGLSPLRTGLVFAGFGSKDICPSLSHVEMDGMIGGKIKYLERNYVDIGRSGPTSETLGFAQDDMVQSFVNGVDPIFREYGNRLLRSAIVESTKMILAAFIQDDGKRQSFIDGMSAEFDRLSDEYKKKSDAYVEKTFTQDVKAMVRSMPKQELANPAESLIDITSLKRKVTRERETVGGDVDVAVISRAEGLVWVKRKHYFPAEINSRFFERQRT